jgi:DNA-3-methyladenine glycosylase I
MQKDKTRCLWVTDDPLYINYHDTEWGVPIFDDKKLFEFLILEGAQAGLSWITILKKRDNYRKAFNDFEPEIIARYTNKKLQQLIQDPGIIRNRLKILATVENAKSYLKIKEEYTSFADFIWSFVDGKPIVNQWTSNKQAPNKTLISDEMSKELKKRGFKFIGSTICYAFMQAVGLVNDHVIDCFRHKEICLLNCNDYELK